MTTHRYPANDITGTRVGGAPVDLLDLIHAPAWTADALCAQTDPDVFFADHGQWTTTQAARAICAKCPVRQQCIDYVMSMPIHQHGIWAGTNEEERRQMRRASA